MASLYDVNLQSLPMANQPDPFEQGIKIAGGLFGLQKQDIANKIAQQNLQFLPQQQQLQAQSMELKNAYQDLINKFYGPLQQGKVDYQSLVNQWYPEMQKSLINFRNVQAKTMMDRNDPLYNDAGMPPMARIWHRMTILQQQGLENTPEFDGYAQMWKSLLNQTTQLANHQAYLGNPLRFLSPDVRGMAEMGIANTAPSNSWSPNLYNFPTDVGSSGGSNPDINNIAENLLSQAGL